MDSSTSVVIRPQQACEYLRDIGIPMAVPTLCMGLQQRVFPFGDYIRGDDEGHRDVYIIYDKLLREWAMQRSTYAGLELNDVL